MILLQIYFAVAEEQASAFEAMFADDYAPAMEKQPGYVGSTLLRLFPAAVAQEIGGAETRFNYQMELRFDTEANRRRWADSAEHAVVWPLAQGMSSAVEWRGYDVVG
ncbi:MAG: antibiotic biosynthesis monooxygenase [Caldilineaceae bacterium]